MSRQEKVAYGKHEFRRFPLVTLDPLPDNLDMGDYYKRAAKGELGVRIKGLEKPSSVTKRGSLTRLTVFFMCNRGGRLLQTFILIGQEPQLSHSCPIRTSCQINNNAMFG